MEAFLALRISKVHTRKAPCSCSVGKEGHPARLMAAESSGISQNATSRRRSGCALAQLGLVDTDKPLNVICPNDFELGTVAEQRHSVLTPFPLSLLATSACQRNFE